MRSRARPPRAADPADRATLGRALAVAARHARADGHIAKAIEEMVAGRFDRVAREAESAMSLEPDRPDATQLLADAQRLESVSQLASQKRLEAQERDRQIQKHLKSARTALRAGEYQRTVAEADAALRLDPDQPDAQQLLEQGQAILRATIARAGAAGTDSGSTTFAAPRPTSWYRKLMGE